MEPQKMTPWRNPIGWWNEHIPPRDVIAPGWFSGIFTGLKPWQAYAGVIGLYVASGYLKGLVMAWRLVLFHPELKLKSDLQYLGETLENIARGAAAVMLLWLAIRWLRPRGPVVGPVRRNWLNFHRVGLLSVATLVLGSVCAGVIAGLVGETGLYPAPEQHSTMEAVERLTSALVAGPCEEICLLALPVLLLRAAGRGWWEITTVLVLVRLSFHAYYGWSCLGFAVWAALAVMLFRYTQSVLPMILVHSLRDLPQALGLFSSAFSFWACTLLSVGIVVWACIWIRGEYKTKSSAAPTSA